MIFRSSIRSSILFLSMLVLTLVLCEARVFAQAAAEPAVETIDASKAADGDKKSDKKEDAPPKLVEVTLAKDGLQLSLPEIWKAKKPRSRILEREYAVPKAEGDESDGRLTMMRSGGSVKLNVERWYTQFAQSDGKATKDVAKVTTKKINEQEVTLVDIPGTFSESMGGGPFAPGKTVIREDYRMLGGIVQTKAVGQYVFKLYGPKKTMAEAEKHFVAMIESVKAAEKRSK